MGKQSARIYFQGKDHKEIYYQGHYHKAMYIGSQLVWEKIEGTTAQEIYLEYLVYKNGLYVGCDYYYNSTGNTVGIYAGTDLENMHLVGKLDKSNVWYRGISMLINDFYVLITEKAGTYHWYTWQMSEGNLSAETYSHNNIPSPIIIDLSTLTPTGNFVDIYTARSAAIIRDKIYIPNNAGFNDISYNDDAEPINDVFLKDGIVCGASTIVHAEENVKYLYQYFYSMDENDNITRTEVRFPDAATDAVKAQVIKDVKKNLQDIDDGYILTDISFYNPKNLFVNLGCNESGFMYIVNNKMYRYAMAALGCKVKGISSDGKDSYEADWTRYFAFYWKIDLDKMEVIDFDTDSLSYSTVITYFFRPKWDMPANGEIWSKYESDEFTIYEIMEAIDSSSYTKVTNIIYNIKSEGDKVHKLVLSDIEDPKGDIANIYNSTPVLLHAAYLKENYLYVDITNATYDSSGSHIQYPKAFLKINIETNKGETVRIQTKYIPE